MRFSGETLAVGVSGSLGFLQATPGTASRWRSSKNEEVSHSVRLSSVSGNRTSFAPEKTSPNGDEHDRTRTKPQRDQRNRSIFSRS
jgi:hypothetical protein